MKKTLVWLSIIYAVTLTLAYSGVALAAGKVSLTPTNSSITEGQSVTITVRLDQPIVATPPNDVVVLHLQSSNPGTTTFSPSFVSFTASEWAQPKTFVVTMPENATYGDSRNVLLTATASSGSGYYNGYTAGASVRVTDTTPVPSQSPTVDTSADDPYSYPSPPQAPVVASPPASQSTALPQMSSPTDTTVSMPARVQEGLTNTPAEAGPNHKFESRFFGYLSGGPGTTSTRVAYLGAIVATLAAGLVPYIYFRRRIWERRQKSRHMRWSERHAKTSVSSQKRRGTKKTPKKWPYSS